MYCGGGNNTNRLAGAHGSCALINNILTSTHQLYSPYPYLSFNTVKKNLWNIFLPWNNDLNQESVGTHLSLNENMFSCSADVQVMVATRILLMPSAFRVELMDPEEPSKNGYGCRGSNAAHALYRTTSESRRIDPFKEWKQGDWCTVHHSPSDEDPLIFLSLFFASLFFLYFSFFLVPACCAFVELDYNVQQLMLFLFFWLASNCSSRC